MGSILIDVLFSPLGMDVHPQEPGVGAKKRRERERERKEQKENTDSHTLPNKVPDGAGALRVLGPANPRGRGSSRGRGAAPRRSRPPEGIVCMQERHVHTVKTRKRAPFFLP